MAIQGISTQQANQLSGQTSGASVTEDALDKSQFLKLLLAQIKNQDPLNPQDNSEFTSQLAQITSVENLESLNSQISGLTSSLQLTQSLSAQALIGKMVLAPANVIQLDDGGGLTGEVHIPEDTDLLTLYVLDEQGNEVDKISMGDVDPGAMTFSSVELPAGVYSITAVANVDGENVNAPVNLAAKVESVTIPGNGQDTLLSLKGIGKISLSSIQTISQ
ncbi:hypothetical protein [Endozoicomonas sp. Mp262]|uniref:flagellar hook assembly protein FlgD n=1 Tax=Endozoicomonas sp. Mp262 TaxID=2919499 RepID=UPI0021D975EE